MPDELKWFQIVASISAAAAFALGILGWLCRSQPASPRIALLLLLAPFMAVITHFSFGDWQANGNPKLSLIAILIYCTSVPWCFFYAYRARKAERDKVLATAALAIASFLIIPLLALSFGFAFVMVKVLGQGAN